MENGRKILEEIIAENFPNLMKNLDTQDAQQILNKIKTKRCTLRHNIVKLLETKNKEKILKGVREKQLTMYKKTVMRLTANFP